MSCVRPKFDIPNFNTVIELAYTILFVMAVGLMLKDLTRVTEKNFHVLVVSAFMAFVLILQMCRLYFVLHMLDAHSKTTQHFLFYIKYPWIIFERFLRFAAAFLIIAVSKFGLDIFSTLVRELSFYASAKASLQAQRITEWIGADHWLSRVLSLFTSEGSIPLPPDVAIRLTVLTVMMLLLYFVFICWDCLAVLSAKLAPTDTTGGQYEDKRLESLLIYLNPMGQKTTISYPCSKKLRERLLGIGFCLIVFIFANVATHPTVVLLIGLLGTGFIVSIVKDGHFVDLITFPFRMILSILKR